MRTRAWSCLLLLQIVVLVNCKPRVKLKRFQKDRTIERIVKEIKSSSAIEDFMVCTDSLDRSPTLRQVRNEFLHQIGKNSTVTSVSNAYQKASRLAKKNFHKLSRHIRVSEKNCLCNSRDYYEQQRVIATDKTLIVYILSISKLQSTNIPQMYALMHTINMAFASPQSTPKVLLVFVTKQKFKQYDSMLHALFRGTSEDKFVMLLNINILEISPKRKTKFGVAFDYNVFQLNPFTRKFAKGQWKSGFKWYPDKLQNCKKFKLNVKDIKQLEYIPNAHFLPNRDGWVTISKIMNITIRFRNNEDDRNCWLICTDDLIFGSKIFAISKPITFYRSRTLVPVIYDITPKSNVTTILLHLLVTAFIVAIFWFFAWLYHFDFITWSTTEIFKLIFGGSTARIITRPAEVALFLCIITAGFFFGGELISGLTTSAIDEETPRIIESLEDLKQNNVTFAYCSAKKMPKNCKCNGFGALLSSGVNLTYVGQLTPKNLFSILRNVVRYQNTSLSLFNLDLLGPIMPETITIKDKLLAKKADIPEAFKMYSYVSTKVNDPFIHRISDIIQRYGECRVRRNSKASSSSAKKRKKAFQLEKLDQFFDEEEEEEESSLALQKLWYFIPISVVLPLIVLLIEICIHRLTQFRQRQCTAIRRAVARCRLKASKKRSFRTVIRRRILRRPPNMRKRRNILRRQIAIHVQQNV